MKTLGAECPVFPMATGRATGTVANPLPENEVILLTFFDFKKVSSLYRITDKSKMVTSVRNTGITRQPTNNDLCRKNKRLQPSWKKHCWT